MILKTNVIYDIVLNVNTDIIILNVLSWIRIKIYVNNYNIIYYLFYN